MKKLSVLCVCLWMICLLPCGVRAENNEDILRALGKLPSTSSDPGKTTSATTKVIGEWRDAVGKAFDNKIKIVWEGNKIYAITTLEDGESLKQELFQESKDGKTIYRVVNSLQGDYFVINQLGNLELYDDWGFIREAKRIR